MPNGRLNRWEFPEARHQFGGFGGVIGGGVGISIPAFGSGGGFAGVPGFAAAAGAINPFATLEAAFGTGVTAQSIADAIRVAEQEGRFTTEGPVTGAIRIATGAIVSLVLNLARGLFEIIDQGGKVVGVGVTPEAALESLNAGGGILAGGGGGPQPPTFPPTLTTVTTPPFVAPPQPTAPIASPEALAAFLSLVGELFRRGDDPLGTPLPPAPVIPPFPPFPTPNVPPPLPTGPQRVAPGGTVNVPRVLGATGDPAGVRRPTFPNEEQLSRAQQIGQIIRNLLLLRKARQNADKQRRAFEQFLAARLELLRGAQMPFGQAGFVGAGPLIGSGAGELIQALIGAGAGFLGERFGQGAATALPAFPAAPGGAVQGPLLGGIGGGGCPPLFRTGAPAGFSMRPVPWFPVQAPNGKWFFFGHLGRPTFSKLKSPRRHHHHPRKR